MLEALTLYVLDVLRKECQIAICKGRYSKVDQAGKNKIGGGVEVS